MNGQHITEETNEYEQKVSNCIGKEVLQNSSCSTSDGIIRNTSINNNNNDDSHSRRLHLRSRNNNDDTSIKKINVVVDGTSTTSTSTWKQTLAGIAGNVLEWYDFAIFGYFGDIIGTVFFPPSSDETITTSYAFLLFGAAFFVRPIGGIVLGYIGDVYSRKVSLIVSIFLMAFPTFLLGCLPTYNQIGPMAIVLLVLIRLLQGFSVGGQLMSSLCFTLEKHDKRKWGFYGSLVMSSASFGVLLGSGVASILRSILSKQQLLQWGWRIPFIAGIVVSLSGFYLKSTLNDDDDDDYNYILNDESIRNDNYTDDSYNNSSSIAISVKNTALGQSDPVLLQQQLPVPVVSALDDSESSNNDNIITIPIVIRRHNPIREAFGLQNLRALLAATLVPMLAAAAYYLCFVWMAIYMTQLLPESEQVPDGFVVNTAALLFSACILYPIAGILSDKYGRTLIMSIGAFGLAICSPILIMALRYAGTIKNPMVALAAQWTLGLFVSMYNGPMCAWLVESFPIGIRLTSVSIGYNIANMIAGGMTPFLATRLVSTYGPESPGWILSVIAIISLTGLLVIAPKKPEHVLLPDQQHNALQAQQHHQQPQSIRQLQEQQDNFNAIDNVSNESITSCTLLDCPLPDNSIGYGGTTTTTSNDVV